MNKWLIIIGCIGLLATGCEKAIKQDSTIQDPAITDLTIENHQLKLDIENLKNNKDNQDECLKEAENDYYNLLQENARILYSARIWIEQHYKNAQDTCITRFP